MKKFLKAAALILSCSMILTSCSSNSAEIEAEIEIPPIYESADKDASVVKAQITDLSLEESCAGSIGYAFADSLSTTVSGNLVSCTASLFGTYKEGETIAVIECSSEDYTYKRLEQEIVMNSALDAYNADPSEKNRLTYECEKAKLEAIEYEISTFNVVAPYDCVVSDCAYFTEGQEIEAGTFVCAVGRPDEICAYVSASQLSLPLGAKVNVTLTGGTYEGTVVSVPPKTSSSSFDMNFDQNNGSLSMGHRSASSDIYTMIAFEPDVLAALLEETPNAASAGWATISAVTKSVKNVLAVPANAVTDRGSTYVYLYKDGQRIQTPVQTGETINGYTIIMNGINEGDEVVVS